MIDSEGYRFVVQMDAKAIKMLAAARACIQRLTTNVLLRANAMQHADVSASEKSLDYFLRAAAKGVQGGYLVVDMSPQVALAFTAGKIGKGLKVLGDKDGTTAQKRSEQLEAWPHLSVRLFFTEVLPALAGLVTLFVLLRKRRNDPH